MEASSQTQNEKGFEWNQSTICNKSNIKIGDAAYFHDSMISISFLLKLIQHNIGIFFQCKLDVDYKLAQNVYCLRCCKKLKSNPGKPIKYSFHTLQSSMQWH